LNKTVPAGAPARLRTLDYGRFIAASIVVLDHALWWVSHFAATPDIRLFGGFDLSGNIGVEYFFVLSAFVMLLAHAGDFGRVGSVWPFWWRRICRIYPVLWLVLLLSFAVLTPPRGGMALLGTFTLFSPLVTHYINPAWTLRYEAAFYILFGLALLPWIGRWLLGLWVAVLAWSLLPVPVENLTPHALRHLLRACLFHHAGVLVSPISVLFVAGLLAAWLYLWRPLGAAAGAVLAGAGVLGLAALAWTTGWYSRFPGGLGFVALGTGFAALILGLAVLERAGTLNPGPLAGRLGALSYPLYVLHVPLLLAIGAPLTGRLHLGLVGLYGLLAAVLVIVYSASALLTDWFDRPVRRRLGALWAHRTLSGT
jgi:exopolysaccharide production protein ExoZ